MRHLIPGYSMTIRGRLISLGAIATIGFASLVAVGWYSGSETLKSASQAETLRNDIRVINEMRLANIEMVLAAMDSIIDKAEGKIQPERQEIIRASVAVIRDNTEKAVAMSNVLGRPELTQSMTTDLADVEQAIAVDLPRLIERDATEDEFAALDDAIDGGGERLNEALTMLAQLGNDAVSARLADVGETALWARNWLNGLAGGFLVLIGIVAVITARYIGSALHRFGQDMEAIAAGNLDTEIEAENRKDEIGRMATSLVAFREAALEKVELERSAEANRSLSERERREREDAKAEEARQIKMAVDSLAGGLNRLADGDLTVQLDTPFVKDLEVLRRDFNSALRRLGETIDNIGGAASQINSGTEEIRSAADDMARRAEQQAAAVEQTAAAVEEITGAVKSSTVRAEETGKLVEKTRKDAEHSGEVVRKAVDAMGRIAKSSEDISRIIGVIDEIAFQTNLLALNAGVEAARAGDAGKGFAVVAQEVRELAQRSANAAKEIKQLITTSSEEVASGVSQVSETGKALEAIIVAVAQVSSNVASIIESAREQSGGLQEVNTSVGSIDQGTQQSAAMAEQATAATHSLREEVVRINEMLSEFRTARQKAESAPASHSEPDRPQPSPVRALGRKIAGAFRGNTALKPDDWEEF